MTILPGKSSSGWSYSSLQPWREEEADTGNQENSLWLRRIQAISHVGATPLPQGAAAFRVDTPQITTRILGDGLGLLCILYLVNQSCPTLCDPMDYSSPGSSVHGILQKNTGVGSQPLPQGIFLTQGSNLGLLRCRQILYLRSHQQSGGASGAPYKYEALSPHRFSPGAPYQGSHLLWLCCGSPCQAQAQGRRRKQNFRLFSRVVFPAPYLVTSSLWPQPVRMYTVVQTWAPAVCHCSASATEFRVLLGTTSCPLIIMSR